jgi:uncharacterized protein (DUF2147 family)
LRNLAADVGFNASRSRRTVFQRGLGRCLAVALSLLAALPALPAAAAPVALSSLISSPIEGTWRTENGTEVTIAPCPEGFCGSLSWVVIPKANSAQCNQDKAAFGALMTDMNNQNKALRKRPILGMQMLTVKPTGDPLSFTASIYNAEDGKTYDGLIWVVNGNSTLRLGGGCIASMCVITQDWPRVPERPDTPDFTCDGN